MALRLKKAWLLCVAMAGVGNLKPPLSPDELVVPDYQRWSRAELQSHVPALEADLDELLGAGVRLAGGKKTLRRVAEWLERHYDDWQEAGGGMHTISTVLEFERQVGPLRFGDRIDAPVYGEMLLQGAHGLAIRHPEYMLVRDVGLLFDLHQDVDRLLDSARIRDAAWATAAGENRQSLARAVILTCFNLLESFANGLAREWLMLNPGGDSERRKQLEDLQKPLRTRLLTVVLTRSDGRCSLDLNKPPMSQLFGPIKNRRDAFVHCDPGPHLFFKGYSKEEAFHDVPPPIVTETVRHTFDVIRTAWRDVHEREGPLWLPRWQGERFGKENVTVAMPTSRQGA